jgi:type VI secretion system secreted protein Hcp
MAGAVDFFLKLEGIDGESHDAKHKNEIDIESWSFGETQPGTMAQGGGGGAGKANFTDLKLIHSLDKASPVLMKACAMGDHFDEATLVARKAGKGQQDYLMIKMKEVFITNIQPSGSTEHPTENVGMTFGHVTLDYKPQKADGSLDAAVQFIYDIKKQVDK